MDARANDAFLTHANSNDGEAFLRFMRDEGFELLDVFRRIRDARKRALIVELARAIAEAQPKVDGA